VGPAARRSRRPAPLGTPVPRFTRLALRAAATPIGEDCARAVRFIARDRLDELLDQPGSVTWLTEEKVAERLRALRADRTAWLGSSSAGRFTLAGAQAKTALLHRDGRWGVPSGATPRRTSSSRRSRASTTMTSTSTSVSTPPAAPA
jgi:hypothetical protein